MAPQRQRKQKTGPHINLMRRSNCATRDLAEALVRDAIETLVSGNVQEQCVTLRWFSDPDFGRISLRMCCAALDWDVDVICAHVPRVCTSLDYLRNRISQARTRRDEGKGFAAVAARILKLWEVADNERSAEESVCRHADG